MFQTELIAGTSPNIYKLDLTDEVPISLNFNIADIRKPENRNGAYSKTIKLYGTKNNNRFFEHIHEVNIVTNTFNVNLKTPCYVKQDGVIVFEGDLRLMKLSKILQNDIEEITYEIIILGDNSTLFAEIGDDKLEDLDFSAYDHVYSRANQYASWSATQGVGYVYPLIDYGYNGFNTNAFAVEHFRPAFYLKQYVDSIFAAAGKTYTSNFFGTAFFKSLIVPHNGEKFLMNSANQALNEFYVGDDGLTAPTNYPLTYVSTGGIGWLNASLGSAPSTRYICVFNDETTSPFSDPNLLYDNTTGIFTVNSTGQYNISAKIAHEVLFNHSLTFTSVVVSGASFFTGRIYKRASPTSAWVQLLTGTLSYVSGTWGVGSSIATVNYNNSNVSLLAGEQLLVTCDILVGGGLGAKYYNGITEVTSGTASFDINLANTSSLKFALSSANYLAGQNLTVNDAIPKDIKQKDFLNSVFRLFNIYVDIDKTDKNNYIIEPRNDFYAAGTTLNWSAKLAWDRPFDVTPMGEIDAKKFIYKYKDDTDYYNKTYTESWGESYGQHTQLVVNDFTKNENKTEVIFSPTEVVDNGNNDLIVPNVFAYDGTNVKPMKHNLRLLMYNGAITNNIPWSYTVSSPTFTDSLGTGNVAMYTYPQAAMVDDPLAPTESIEFGVPNEVFYNLGTNYTTNNLYNRFYSRFMNEITDRDSMIVTAYFKLDPQDIANFDFRNRVYVKESYYYVNKIMDFNPIANDLTKVELLKIKDYDDYVAANPAVTAITTNFGDPTLTGRMFGGVSSNVGLSNSLVVGDNNVSRSAGSVISGTGNTVESDSYKISMVSTDYSSVGVGCSGVALTSCSGCEVGYESYGIALTNCFDVIVEAGVHDFVGINLVNESITSADNGTTRLGGEVVNFGVTTETQTASFTVDPDINVYYIDCTAGNVTATYDPTAHTYTDRIIYFKRVDASGNTFTIDETTGSPTIDGNPVPYNTLMPQWDSFALIFNGTNFITLCKTY